MDRTTDCRHARRAGDNYGESCVDCGAQLSGYGYGGPFGVNITGSEQCIHLWSPIGDGGDEVCIYCESWRNGSDTIESTNQSEE